MQSSFSAFAQVPLLGPHSMKLAQNIAKLFNNEKYSDAKVVIHGVATLPVHKSIICPQSAYFEKAFQKGAFVEGSSGVLTFNDSSAAAYWSVFEYMYVGHYSEKVPEAIGNDPVLLQEPRIYALADMFFLSDLKGLCTARLRKKLLDLWKCDSFPDCIREVYTSTPSNDKEIRRVVVEVAKTHIRELGAKMLFKELVREGGDFAVDILEEVLLPAPSSISSPTQLILNTASTNTLPGSSIFGTGTGSGFNTASANTRSNPIQFSVPASRPIAR